MRLTLIVASIVLGLIIIFQIYTSMAAAKSETQPYKVIRKEKEFEVRFYPAVTMATITSSAKTYSELGNSGFRKLAGYIFGGNSTKLKIAMTAPVHMDINDSASTMSFVMPAEYYKDNLPKPNDAGVKIETSSDEYVAAIVFGGYASTEKIQKYKEILESALKKNNISYYGNFRYLGYNPPYQVFGRIYKEFVTANSWQ